MYPALVRHAVCQSELQSTDRTYHLPHEIPLNPLDSSFVAFVQRDQKCLLLSFAPKSW